MISFDWHGVKLSANHFSRDLTGYIAFSIGFAGNTHCRDVDAATELLNHESRQLIQEVALSVLTSVPPCPTCIELGRDGAANSRCFQCAGRIVHKLHSIASGEPPALPYVDISLTTHP